MSSKLTKDEVLSRFHEVHGDTYDYSKVEYRGIDYPVDIICRIHGMFHQTPYSHIKGSNCPECAKIERGRKKSITSKGTYFSTKEEFVKKAIKAHENKYDYSRVDYKGVKEKVEIICPKHGSFWQTPAVHLQGKGCPKCGHDSFLERTRSTKDEYIQSMKKQYGDAFDYSKVEYVNARTPVILICNTCGKEFTRKPKHSEYRGCPYCRKEHFKKIGEAFVERARKVHGDAYDYSKVEYEGSNKKVEIICPKHGSFWQKPNKHLSGHGCPSCAESHGERDVAKWLDDHNIKYERQKRFSSCKNIRTLPFDFWLPEYGVTIEFQGKQHYVPIRKWGGKEGFDLVKLRDSQKRLFCEESGMVEIEAKYNANIQTLLGTFFDAKS